MKQPDKQELSNPPLELAGAHVANARATPGYIATEKEAYVCVWRRSRPQLSGNPLGTERSILSEVQGRDTPQEEK